MNIAKSIVLFALAFITSSTFVQGQIKGDLPKHRLPSPIYSPEPSFVDLYWKAWELAWDRVTYQEGVPQSPYMDENLWEDTIWIWDTEFMVLFCRYAPDVFPGIQSLDNFYKCILDKYPTSLRIQHPDNPPFYSWVEWEYYKMTGDRDRLQKVLIDNRWLQRHYQWFDSLKIGTKLHFEHAPILLQKEGIGYLWGNIQSGMDNTPRTSDAISDKEMLWMDALAQQALSALYISRIAKELGREDIAEEYDSLYADGKRLLNDYYWDETDGFYYDLNSSDNTHIKVRTPAVYWTMLAEVPDREQASRVAAFAADSLEFGGKYPWPTVSRRHHGYEPETGDYWRGGIWLPTAYMSTKALEAYGYHDLADENALKLLRQMDETYRTYSPATIWEAYSPTAPRPSEHLWTYKPRERVRPDFCGWSALGPISLFIENVLGFHNIDAQARLVEWRKKGDGNQGIRNLRFGDTITDIVANGSKLTVSSNQQYTLRVNGKNYKVKKGNNKFKI
ncbi:MAG: alpha,alpha-trehalase [Muribaculaceae bacterium]|nr:alpha,alpha-trehalase [Muribaculaceae bacterium]